MDSRIRLSAVVATALLLGTFANKAAAGDPAAKPAATPPAFSSGTDTVPAGTDAGGDKVAPASSSDAGGDKVAPAGSSDAGGDKVAPAAAPPSGE
jgi:hypothetical protein